MSLAHLRVPFNYEFPKSASHHAHYIYSYKPLQQHRPASIPHDSPTSTLRHHKPHRKHHDLILEPDPLFVLRTCRSALGPAAANVATLPALAAGSRHRRATSIRSRASESAAR